MHLLPTREFVWVKRILSSVGWRLNAFMNVWFPQLTSATKSYFLSNFYYHSNVIFVYGFNYLVCWFFNYSKISIVDWNPNNALIVQVQSKWKSSIKELSKLSIKGLCKLRKFELKVWTFCQIRWSVCSVGYKLCIFPNDRMYSTELLWTY